MTTAPRFTVARDDRRECALYRIYVLDPRTNYTTKTLGYIGETGRMPFTRFMEHLYDQPWGDTIIGTPEVDDRRFASKTAVLAAEKAAVLAEKPLYNIEYQKGAPHQIPQWTAREQRAERDRAKGKVSPDWAAKGQRVTVDPVKPSRQPARRPWSVKARRRRNRTVAWVASALGLWAALALFTAGRGVPWQVLPVGSAGAVSAGYVWLLPKRRRKTAWILLAAATVILAGVVTR